MYVRTLKQSQVKNISKFMSLKNDSIIRTESMLEFDMCFHLEYSPLQIFNQNNRNWGIVYFDIFH